MSSLEQDELWPDETLQFQLLATPFPTMATIDVSVRACIRALAGMSNLNPEERFEGKDWPGEAADEALLACLRRLICCNTTVKFQDNECLGRVEALADSISEWRNINPSQRALLQACEALCEITHSYFMDRLDADAAETKFLELLAACNTADPQGNTRWRLGDDDDSSSIGPNAPLQTQHLYAPHASLDDLENTEEIEANIHTVEANEVIEGLANRGPLFEFWERWFASLVDGDQIDWELQRRVALIDNAIWEAGPAAMAAEIKRIQEEFDRQNRSSEPRQTDFEPDSLERVLSNKVIAATSTAYVSAAIGEAISAYHTETGRNEIPEPFVPLAQMPTSLQSIGAILQLAEQTDEAKQQLREEIGRLNAKVAKLEKELEALRSKGDPVFRDAVTKSLGDWKLWAALVAGGWIVLGDVEGAQVRLENIQSLRDGIFGAPSAPSPDIAPFDDPTVDV